MAKTYAQVGYESRKFWVTMSAMIVGGAITVAAMYSVPPAGFFTALSAFYILLGTCVGAYNWSNLRHHQSDRE